MEQERKVEPIGRELVRRLLPRRDPEGHKGTFGKVLCLCGSVGYTGAPVFASRGAVRSGAGLVFLGVPESIWPVAAVKSDEAMPFPLPEAEGRLSLLAEELQGDPRPKLVVGDGAALCSGFLSEAGIPCRMAPAQLVMQNAVGVALAAEEMAARGETVSARDLVPVYLRLSQAERERLAKGLKITLD